MGKSKKNVKVEDVEQIEIEMPEIPSLDDKTKKATIRFMKTYGVESVKIQGFDFTLESLGSSPKGSKKVKKEKKPKDPNAPKLPLTSYMRFQNHFNESEREKMKAKAAKKGIKYAKLVSEMWAKLDDDGKKPYQDAYLADKKVYDVAKEKYLAKKKESEEEPQEEEAEEEVQEEEPQEEQEEEVKEVKKPKSKKGKDKSKKN